MSSLYIRSLDLHKLKAPYRYGIALFTVGGLVAGFILAADVFYSLKLAWGFTPGAPVGSEPGGLPFLALSLVVLMGLGFVGMALGALVLCILLASLSHMTFRKTFRAIFLSYYPAEWYSEESDL